jgi:hypothetical protein
VVCERSLPAVRRGSSGVGSPLVEGAVVAELERLLNCRRLKMRALMMRLRLGGGVAK